MPYIEIVRSNGIETLYVDGKRVEGGRPGALRACEGTLWPEWLGRFLDRNPAPQPPAATLTTCARAWTA
jgi:hypothetical protein